MRVWIGLYLGFVPKKVGAGIGWRGGLDLGGRGSGRGLALLKRPFRPYLMVLSVVLDILSVRSFDRGKDEGPSTG